MPTVDLTKAPSLFRAAVARGIDAPEKAIDRSGGDFGAGIVRGFAVVTRGEALGHDMWVDGEFVGTVAEALAAAPSGLKSRFTHPSLSGDGMGKFLGRAKGGATDGDVARADLHLSESATRSPDGDLASYVMDLAEEDPQAFGTSIVFERDTKAELDFLLAHGATVDDYGYVSLQGFKSPDPLNEKNLPHARLGRLRAVDVVDEPAANPSGMFHATEIPAEAEAVCLYALGLSDTRPASASFGVDPDRLRGFASRFLSHRGLVVAKKGDGDMPKPTKLNAAVAEPEATETPEVVTPEPQAEVIPEPVAETPPVAEAVAEVEPEKEPEAEAPAAESGMSEARKELGRYVAAFGAEDGAKWFGEGKPFAECQGLCIGKLREEKKQLAAQLAAAREAMGEVEPVSASVPEGTPEKPASRFSHLGPKLSKVAAGIKLPAGRN